MTIGIVTVASGARIDHLRIQQSMLDQLDHGDLVRTAAWLDAAPPPHLPSLECIPVAPGEHGLRVGAGRNAAARAAADSGADLLVFLDADCVPGEGLVEHYRQAAGEHPSAVLCGPVTYLRAEDRPSRISELRSLTAPHPDRRVFADGEYRVARPDEYDLFWSLSFAITVDAWDTTGGFDERYEGYGAEDTDLAWRCRKSGIPLVWVGGAHAYHQWHPSSSPPWRHLDDILRNGRLFAQRWGSWPMSGWLEAFAAAGAITRVDGSWVRERSG